MGAFADRLVRKWIKVEVQDFLGHPDVRVPTQRLNWKKNLQQFQFYRKKMHTGTSIIQLKTTYRLNFD